MRHLGHNSRLKVLLLIIASIAFSSRLFGAEIWSDETGTNRLALDTALKATGLFSHAPHDPILYPDQNTAIGLFRTRLDLRYSHDAFLVAGLAYEHRATIQTEGAAGGVGSAVLPGGGEIPYRITPLDWQVYRNGNTFLWRHEIDRALVSLHPEWGEVTIGRQAIGLGRGVLFSAVDMFAPFSPTEVDREWRRGVDAARVEYRFSDRGSLEGIGVFGRSWDESALIGRARGYLGAVDGELLFGKRGRDLLAAIVSSAAVLDAEVHGEVALFDVPEKQPDGGTFGNDNLVAKAVLGASYTFDVGNGLTVLGEYHYSGFGIEEPKNALAILAMNPKLQERFLRGDTQTLGRHNVGIQASYPINEVLSSALLMLASARDGSGLASPSLVWDVRRNVTFLVSGFAPWGPRPSGGNIRSEYGGTPWSLFMQVNVYF
jgi:hypothetical protein